MTVVMSENAEVRRAKRSWPAQYKLDILNEIDSAKTDRSGAVGEICRREGLYSSLITQWRHQRDAGALEGLSDRPAGRPKADRTRAKLAKAEDEVSKLRSELVTARELIEAQGKVSALLAELSRRSAEQNTTKP
jgi:transposase-like protein